MTNKTNDIIINEAYIRQFNPNDRMIDNFNSHYPDWQGSLADLMELEYVGYDDKLWLAKHVIRNMDLWQIFALDCAIVAQEHTYAADANANAAAINAVYTTHYASDAARSAEHYAADAAHNDALYAADAVCFAAYYAAQYATHTADSALETERNRQLAALVYLLDNE